MTPVLKYWDENLKEYRKLGVRGLEGPPGPPGPAASADIGDVKLTARPAPPPGWLLCNGAAISRSVYAELFDAIATTYGAGDGATTFNLPDLRDRVPIGAGGSRAPNAQGGAETVALASMQMPSHNHGGVTNVENQAFNFNFGAWTGGADRSLMHTHGVTNNAGDPWGGSGGSEIAYTFMGAVFTHASQWDFGGGLGRGWTTDGGAYNGYISYLGTQPSGVDHLHYVSGTTSTQNQNHNHNIPAEGGGEAHNNMQPFIAMNYVIFSGII